MLVEVRARNLTTAAEVADNIRRTRDYIRSLNTAPQPTDQIEPPCAPGVDQSVAVLQAVAMRTGLSYRSIMLDVMEEPTKARRIAIALCILHLRMQRDVVAEFFGVQSDAVERAAEHCRPFYLDALIPDGAQLLQVVCAVCSEYLGPPPALRVTALEVITEVCVRFRVPVVDLRSKRQDRATTYARLIAMLVLRQLTTLSSTQIGMQLKRDHSTVLKNYWANKHYVEAAGITLPARATVSQWVRALMTVTGWGPEPREVA